jgi:uncharacterized 2Fe-2S/4Fe-4S cluster protein (DUF4445 family)
VIITFEYSINSEQVFRFMGYKKKTDYPPELLREVELAILESSEYIQAKAIIEEVYFTFDEPKRAIILPKGQNIYNECLIEKVKNSSFLLMGITTLGPGFAEKESSNDGMWGIKNLILDAIGCAVLNNINQQLRNIIKVEYYKRGLELTHRLTPGENDIPLELQKVIFELLDTEILGVYLTKALMMEPLKSCSVIYGVVRQENLTKESTAIQEDGCSECNLEECIFREEQLSHQVVVIKGAETKTLISQHGENLYQLLIRNGVKVTNSCGGNHSCGKCVVQLEAQLPIPMSSREKNLLLSKKTESGARLSCFINVEQDLEVALPVESKAQIYVQGHKRFGKRKSRDREPDGDSPYGIAVDLGTTTVAVYLLDLETGEDIDIISFLNPQQVYGADVLTRINYTLQQKKGLMQLNCKIIESINTAIKELCKRNSLHSDNIYEMTVVGNTTMLYLFLGLPCNKLAQAPYSPVYTCGTKIAPNDLDIKINRIGRLIVLPGISAFAGADTLAAVGACGMHEDSDINLLIDIGTNGEIVLGNKDRMISCSTAAGPAFEGGRITCGIGGVSGAIDHVNFRWDKLYTTINNQDPVGICGSGVLDVIAELLRYGIIDKSGRMKKKNEMRSLLSSQLLDRLIENEGQPAFLLDKDTRIIVTQKDVREFQLAKGAIYAGISILLKQLKIGPSDIGKVYLAGGFGNYLDLTNAFAVKLIQAEFHDLIVPIGNAAGSGARIAIASKGFYQSLKKAKEQIEYLELSLVPEFQADYIKALDF